MSNETPVQPTLADLMARYLNRQAEAHAVGLAAFDPTAEVQPYDAGPVQPVDPKPAWDEAVAVFAQGKLATKGLKAPPQWAHLVAHHEPEVALAFCVGNFPQLVRNFHLILHKGNLAEMRPQPGRPVAAPALIEWAERTTAFPQMLLAAGALRLAKHYDAAEKMLERAETLVSADTRAALDNEKAALAWHRGRVDAALKMWDAQPPTVAVKFNRGMANLFLDNQETARVLLTEVVTELPEESAWHHLAHLYLTLAQGE